MVGSDGHKYLEAHAVVRLDDELAGPAEIFVEVTAEDLLIVTVLAGAPLPAVPPPDEFDEGLVWVDELRWVNDKMRVG